MTLIEESLLNSFAVTLSLVFRGVYEESMDSDKVNDVVRYVKAYLDRQEDNITDTEFEETIQELEERRTFGDG